MAKYSSDFEKALSVGRPPNIVKLFPDSKALIISGKVIDRAFLAKSKAMTIAANGRNNFVIRGSLKAAQKANAAIIIEIAKSEAKYCYTNFSNIAEQVNAACNELGITIPVAVHADHYAVKNKDDFDKAKKEIPEMFKAGITSLAIDASHLPEEENLLINIDLSKYIPAWAGYETEIGEIKGEDGLSTPKEALFLIEGLNAYGISPDWIALNNGTTHGIETSSAGIQVGLTAEIHNALALYNVSGAQHGTSGNSSDRLREIASKTKTTKANVATSLQMISWGVKVNDYGNAILTSEGKLSKIKGKGISEEVWAEMVSYAEKNGWNAGNYKNLNLPFESKFNSFPENIKEQSIEGVEEFVYKLLTEVFNASDTAPIAIDILLKANSYDLGPKARRIADPSEWTTEKIKEKAKALGSNRGPDGDYDD